MCGNQYTIDKGATMHKKLTKMDALKAMSKGTTIDQSAFNGTVMIISENNHVAIEHSLLLSLKEKGYIKKTKRSFNWHPIFHPSFSNPVDIYAISEKGKIFVNDPNSSMLKVQLEELVESDKNL